MESRLARGVTRTENETESPRAETWIIAGLLCGTLAENGGAEADLRGALFNGDFEIVAHAHGKLREGTAKAGLQFVAQIAQATEIRAGVARVFADWRNGHQTAQLEMRHLHDGFGERGEILRGDAGLRAGRIHLNFDQDSEPFVGFAGGFVELRGERDVVHGVNPVEKSRGAAGLVALEMADEVPARLKFGKLRLLSFPFLYAIFAKGARAGFISLANRRSGESFRNGDKNDFLGAAVAARGSASDAFADAFDITCDGDACPGHQGILTRENCTQSSSEGGISQVVECVRLSVTPMAFHGKFIAIEGIDGSGKRTQLELLARELRRRGVKLATISFPHYEGFFGRLVARYLNGEFGKLGEVDPHFSALLYAGDRLEHKAEIQKHLTKGRLVLADRYIGSNLAHQSARIVRGKQTAFLHWLEELEYKIYGLPREDLVIYLAVPAETAQRLVSKKGARKYTQRQRDLQEANLAHLKAAASVYDRITKRRNWAKINCLGKGGREILPPSEIHRRVMAALEKRNVARHGRG
jgi:dTMP kinase